VKSDSFDELTSRDKLGRVRVRMEPPLQTTGAAGFNQRLILRNASVVITDATQQRSVVLFVDANARCSTVCRNFVRERTWCLRSAIRVRIHACCKG
jgi:hypothetical protein